MAKIVLASEVAQIISGLLNDPSGMGALDDADTYKLFLVDAAQLVANYCGGGVSGVGEPMGDVGSMAEYHVSVYANDSLPGLTHTVWGAFDNESESGVGVPMPRHAMVFKSEFENWNAAELGEDSSRFDITATTTPSSDGVGLCVELAQGEEPKLSVVIEVDQNHPKVHIGTGVGDDLLLHIASVDGVLHVSQESHVAVAQVCNQYTYMDDGFSIEHIRD